MKKSCKKKRYCTKEYAIDMAEETAYRHGIKMRVYRCQYCQGYHLTKRLEWQH